MKAKSLCLMIAIRFILNLLPVSAAEAPVITIISQPTSLTEVTRGEVSEKLFVTASVSDGSELSYQWYETIISNTNKNGMEISGTTSAEFTIPAFITTSKNYFCEVRGSYNGYC